VPEHVWVHPRQPHPGLLGQPTQAARCAVPIHPGSPHGPQDRPFASVGNCGVDGPGDSRREWDEDHFVAFAVHAQDAVAAFLAQIIDAGAGGFEDPQAE